MPESNSPSVSGTTIATRTLIGSSRADQIVLFLWHLLEPLHHASYKFPLGRWRMRLHQNKFTIETRSDCSTVGVPNLCSTRCPLCSGNKEYATNIQTVFCFWCLFGACFFSESGFILGFPIKSCAFLVISLLLVWVSHTLHQPHSTDDRS